MSKYESDEGLISSKTLIKLLLTFSFYLLFLFFSFFCFIFGLLVFSLFSHLKDPALFHSLVLTYVGLCGSGVGLRGGPEPVFGELLNAMAPQDRVPCLQNLAGLHRAAAAAAAAAPATRASGAESMLWPRCSAWTRSQPFVLAALARLLCDEHGLLSGGDYFGGSDSAPSILEAIPDLLPADVRHHPRAIRN
jgi:hypothetical protein